MTDGTKEVRRPLMCPLTYSRKGGCTLTWTQGSAGQTVIRGTGGLGETEAAVRTELLSGSKNREWLWEWVAEEKAERSPKSKRFRKPEAVGWLMAAELREEMGKFQKHQ